MYDVDCKNIRKGIGFHLIFFSVGLFFGVCMIAPIIQINEPIVFIFILFPLVFLLIGGIGIANIFKRMQLVKRLNQCGKLYKNIPYTLKPSGMSVNGVEIMKPVVEFKLPNGQLVTLSGDARHDRVHGDEDGYIDLVIDPDNYNNYFLDYNINRLEGNRSDDFYKSFEELEREKNNQNPMKYQYPKEFTFGNHNNSNDGRPYKPL